MSQDDPQYPAQPGQTPPPPSWSQPGAGATQPPAQPAAPAYAQPGQPSQPVPPAYAPPPSQPTAPAPGYAQPQGYPAPGYGQAPAYGQPAYGAPAAPKTPAIAIWGLVLAFLAAPVGLILSLIALGKTKRAGAGKGLAIGGVIASIVVMVLGGLGLWAAFKLGSTLVEPSVAVISFNDAIDTADCDAFTENSTVAYRESMGVTDCDTFAEFAANTSGGLEDYTVSVTGMEIGRAHV